ncbi:hypothetical protein [Crenobacter cavernae]|uniref:Uncharacterized protein n=1 Tax=Crenobacter cavernae TaxID=2290923 RepID=A0A345Y6U4_9NEIS|nr:hypothetical protein [Crenobacter cavernae]AXK39646.1 hypothetical protein DWG20_09420 [Crenobacter cavernae]
MNRTQRRSAARTKPAMPPRRRYTGPNRPTLAEVHQVFAPIDWMFDEMRQGEVSEMSGVAAMRDVERNWYQIGPALAGWIDCWQRLDRRFSLGLDLTPLCELGRKLDDGELMTMAEIDAAYAVINRCRELYRQMDVYEVKTVVRTTEIVIALEEAGARMKG